MICGFLSLCQYAHTLTKGDPGPVRRQSPEDCNLEHHRVPTPDGPRRATAATLRWYEKMRKNEPGEQTVSHDILESRGRNIEPLASEHTGYSDNSKQ